MAVIDSKKLLPPSKKSGNSDKFLVPVTSIVPRKSVSITTKLLKPADDLKTKESVSGKGYLVLREKLINVEDILKRNLALQIKETQDKQREEKRVELEEKEKQLELKPEQKAGMPKISLPKIGFLDAIRNFLVNTLLGFVAVKLFQISPQLTKFLDYTKPILKFVEIFSGNLFNGLVEYVDKGYKIYDSIDNTIKQIGGKDASKKFEDFSGQLNKLLNGAIMASMLIISTAPKTPKGAAGGLGSSVSKTLGGVTPKPTSGFGAGTGMTPGRYRLPGQARVGGFALEQARKTATQTSLNQASKQLATQSAKQSLRSVVAVPVIGSLIGFIIDTVVFREKPSRAAAGAVGSALGQGIGIALAGGTTFGLGAGIGMFIGGFVGDWLGKALYDTLTGFNPEPVQARAEGGSVTRGRQKVGGAVTRTIKKQRRTLQRVKPQPTIPGKDVGGLKNIEKLYGKDEPNKRSALRVLKKASEIAKGIRTPFLGNILGIGIDMTLGQKPDMASIKGVGNSFGQFVQGIVDTEVSGAYSNIVKTILGMAEGGVVPRTLMEDANIGSKIGTIVGTLFSTTLSSRVNEIMSTIMRELQLKGGIPGTEGGVIPSMGETAGDFSGDVKVMKAFNYFKSQGYTDFQAAAIIGNLLQENRAMNPTLQNSIGMKGIAQWDANRWRNLEKFALSRGLNPNSFETQLKFIQHELKTGDGGLSATTFKATKNLEDATILFRKQYERPGEAEANDAQRIKYARGVLQSSSFEYVAPGKVMPVVTGRYGEDRKSRTHGGSDLAVPDGTPLRAISDGKVIESGFDSGGWGNYTVYTDKNGVYHLYGHMKGKGRSSGGIKKGDILGYVGMTGYTSGPHLHWETGTGWDGTIQGKFDPLKRYSINAPFNTQRDQIKIKPDKNTPASIFNWQQSSAPTPQSEQVASLGNFSASKTALSNTSQAVSNYSQASGDSPSSIFAIQEIYYLPT